VFTGSAMKGSATKTSADIPLERLLFYALGAAALVYAFLAGLKTIAEFDLGWQMATARWIVQHRQIPSTEVLSYTAAGQPWTYPAGSGLVFYALYLLGGYGLLSWLTACACGGTIALLLRRGSAATAALAILAVPLIASRVTARAEMFTVVLFAATLSLLWEQHQTGAARLWLLPVAMVAWVNLHPGFIAGLGLLGAYVMLEAVDMVPASTRADAIGRLRRAFPWLMATGAATLVNPWGWGVYDVISRQEAALAAHSQLIQEWVPIPLDWAHIKSGLSPFTPDMFYVLLAVVVLAVLLALARRRIGEAILLVGAAFFPLRHVRFLALFGVVVVLIGGALLASCLPLLRSKIRGARVRAILAVAASALLVGMAGMRIRDLVTDWAYRMGTEVVSFGTGLSWWFPEGAAAFVERENLPAQIFSAYTEGGYMAFRLGPKYKNYIDGRAIPFGTELMVRSGGLKASPPDAPAWKQEAERYGINTILIPMGRYVGLQFFPVLKQFCVSDIWVPVYLDETGAVFVRRSPETEALIGRFRVDCSTAPVPAAAPVGNSTEAFNQWSNAASVLKALGRNQEALVAIRKALEIFPDNGYLHFTRGHIFEEEGDQNAAERDFLAATEMEPNLVAPWSALAAYYQEQGRLADAIRAWEKAASVSRSPWEPLENLGYADLMARRPQQALAAFDDAAKSLPEHSELIVDDTFLANIAHGRARSWYRLGNLPRAISYEEGAARLLPASADLWRQLAGLYAAAGRSDDANRAAAHASALP